MGAQRSLFDGNSSIEVPTLGDRPQRTMLSDDAWLDTCQGWIGGADLLFERLVPQIPWQADRRSMFDREVAVPRLTAFYDEHVPLPDPWIVEMLAQLRVHYRADPAGDIRTAGMCLYRDGRDSVAWHGDRIGRGRDGEAIVAIVSLGEPRTFLIRPRGGGNSSRFALGSGDLFVMGGTCQQFWEHCIPKTKRVQGSRLSIQFRTAGVR